MREWRYVTHTDKAAVLRGYFCFIVSQTASLPIMLIVKRLFYFYHYHHHHYHHHHHTYSFRVLLARFVTPLIACPCTLTTPVCYRLYRLFMFNFQAPSQNCEKRLLASSFWHSADRASWYIVIIRPKTYTNFSNFFLEYNSTCFGQVVCQPSAV